MNKPHGPHPGERPQPVPAAARNVDVKRINSADLLRDANELIIVHGTREYRLRITSNGKLILTA